MLFPLLEIIPIKNLHFFNIVIVPFKDICSAITSRFGLMFFLTLLAPAVIVKYLGDPSSTMSMVLFLKLRAFHSSGHIPTFKLPVIGMSA